MKPKVRPTLGEYDHLGKFDGDEGVYKKRGRRLDREEIEKQLEEDDYILPGIICKVYEECPHGCQEECCDKDLVESEPT